MKKINDNITTVMVISMMVYLGIAIALVACERLNVEFMFQINDISYYFSNSVICELIRNAAIIFTVGEIVLLCISTSVTYLLGKEA